MKMKRWTVRNVDSAAIDMIEEGRQRFGASSGELVSAAIRAWHADLAKGNICPPRESLDQTSSSLSELLRRVRSFAG